MATDLAHHRLNRSAPPALVHPQVDRAARAAFSKLTELGLGHEIAATDAPSTAEREAFGRRSALLGLWLEPAGSEALVDEVTKILLMPSRAEGLDDVKALMKLYCADLADLPPFAVVKACAEFRQGRVGDGHWRPTQGDIRQRAEVYAYDLAREKRRLDAVLNATVRTVLVDPARRKAVADMARASIRDGHAMAQQAEAERLGRPVTLSKPPETPDETLARYAAGQVRVPVLSPAGRKASGLGDDEPLAEMRG